MKYLSLSMARLWELNLNLHNTDLSDLFFKESTYGACSPILCRGGSRGGGTRAPPPPWNWKKIWFFGVKSWFFTRNIPKIYAPPSARRNFFKCAPPNLKSWIRPCYVLTITIFCINYNWWNTSDAKTSAFSYTVKLGLKHCLACEIYNQYQ